MLRPKEKSAFGETFETICHSVVCRALLCSHQWTPYPRAGAGSGMLQFALHCCWLQLLTRCLHSRKSLWVFQCLTLDSLGSSGLHQARTGTLNLTLVGKLMLPLLAYQMPIFLPEKRREISARGPLHVYHHTGAARPDRCRRASSRP